MVENGFIDMLETLSVIWFSVEYVIRLISCPYKLEFLRDKLNILDIAAVLPFYVPLCISWLETLDMDTVLDTFSMDKMETEQVNAWMINSGTSATTDEDTR